MTSFVLVPGSHHGGWSFDQVPERVRALVYLEAFVPADGESAWHHELRSQHNLMRDAPDELARVAAAAAEA